MCVIINLHCIYVCNECVYTGLPIRPERAGGVSFFVQMISVTRRVPCATPARTLPIAGKTRGGIILKEAKAMAYVNMYGVLATLENLCQIDDEAKAVLRELK